MRAWEPRHKGFDPTPWTLLTSEWISLILLNRTKLRNHTAGSTEPNCLKSQHKQIKTKKRHKKIRHHTAKHTKITLKLGDKKNNK